MSSIRETAEQIVLNHTRRDSNAFSSAVEQALRNERERAAKIGFKTVRQLGDSVYEYSVTQKAAMVAAAIRKDD